MVAIIKLFAHAAAKSNSVLHVVAPSLIQDVAELFAKTTSNIKALEPFRVKFFLVRLMSAMEKQNLP